MSPAFVSFFFSSRRRHTRWPRDWSSDVCSSDLYLVAPSRAPVVNCGVINDFHFDSDHRVVRMALRVEKRGARQRRWKGNEIGRASCREREQITVMAGGKEIEDVH